MYKGKTTEKYPVLTITIDHRENQSKVPSLLVKNEHYYVRFSQLSAGDYLINEEVCVERKTAKDFITSVVDGRLFIQAKKLRKSGYRILLLVEGDPYQLSGNMHHEAIRGALLSISVAWQIPVIFSKDEKDSATIIRMLAYQEMEDSQPHTRRGYLPKRISGKRLYFLQGLPGIGVKSAQLLLDHFDTLEEIIMAEKEELMSIPSFGKIKANRIFHFLRERW